MIEKLSKRISRAEFLGYGVLFWVKKVLGMRASRHRNYLIWRLIRLIEDGCLDVRKIGVCSTGKRDGAGAQALAKFSAMCFAEAYGMRYVHAPFDHLAHAEGDVAEWNRSWEELLRMGEGVERLDRDEMRAVSLMEFLEDRELWGRDVVLCERHYHSFCELAPEFGEVVSGRLKVYFRERRERFGENGVCRIGVHVRRGDVGRNDVETRHRFQPTSEIIRLVSDVVAGVRRVGLQEEIHVHSNGSMDEMAEFGCFEGTQYHVGTSALDTFVGLATSDVLMCTRSDFSVLAGIYCEGVVVCDERYRTPLPGWLGAKGGNANLAEVVYERLKWAGGVDKISETS